MKNVTVSVVMAEYSTEIIDLKMAIRSILNQTYRDFELIIVDDCGRNNLSELVAELHDSRIKILKNDVNRGLIYSLNRGVREARGRYIARMDTDDIAMPDRLKTQYEFMVKNPQWDVVGVRAIEFSELKDEGLLGVSGEKTAKSIMRGDSLIHPGVMMKKAAIQAVGGYKHFKRAEDLAMWCELLLAGYRLYVMDDVLLRYRVNTTDYKKRKLKNRTGEIKARLHYYPKMGAGLLEYVRVLKSVTAGILPTELVQRYRSRYVLKQEKVEKRK